MRTGSEVIVIGAGPAGIASALSLRDRGVHALVVERGDRVASTWHTHYDRLKLNTGRQFSHLPKRRYPKGTPMFPARDQVIDHLERHARGLDIRLNTSAERIDPSQGGWRLTTSTGDVEARQVVVATGYQHTPHIPEWPGVHGFTGEVLHAAGYRNPKPYVGKRVLVVGSGSSGMEIAHDVATSGAAKVWMAVRTPPNIMLRTGPGGVPGDVISTPLYHAPLRVADRIAKAARQRTLGDLTEFGLPIPDEGPFTRLARLGVAPSLVDMEVIDAVKNGAIEVVKAPESFDGADVSLLDGTVLQPDAVVCATGYLHGLEPLVGHLDVLDERGKPRVLAPLPAAPGLRFIGFLARPSQLGYCGRVARPMAKRIAAELR